MRGCVHAARFPFVAPSFRPLIPFISFACPLFVPASVPAVFLEKRKGRPPRREDRSAAEVQSVHVPLQAHAAEPAALGLARAAG